MSGKQRHVRLVPVRALDGDEVEWIKVAETKGCITLTTGVVRRNPLTYCLCVAIKKQVRRLYNTNRITIILYRKYNTVYFAFVECIASHYLWNNAYKNETQTYTRINVTMSRANSASSLRRTFMRWLPIWFFDLQYIRRSSSYL